MNLAHEHEIWHLLSACQDYLRSGREADLETVEMSAAALLVVTESGAALHVAGFVTAHRQLFAPDETTPEGQEWLRERYAGMDAKLEGAAQ